MGRTFRRTFSNDGGETMEKQMRKMSVAGYDSGRRRLRGGHLARGCEVGSALMTYS
jgi:hypothetical protein